MKIVIIGNKSSCGYCAGLAKIVGTFQLAANASAASVASYRASADPFLAWLSAGRHTLVDADKSIPGSGYGDYKAASLKQPIAGMPPKGGYLWPVVSVYDGATLKGSFVARRLKAPALIAKLEALCPSCSDTPAAPARKPCPTCKGTGLALLALAALIGAGCISQKVVINQPLPSGNGTNDVALVEASYGGTNGTYRAQANVVVSMGIYSTKKIDPQTTATIPLK